MKRSLAKWIRRKNEFTEDQLIAKAREICKDLRADFFLRLQEFVFGLEDERIQMLTPTRGIIRHMIFSPDGLSQYEKFVEQRTGRLWEYEQLKRLWDIVRLEAYPKSRTINRETYLRGKVDEYGKCICAHCGQEMLVTEACVDHIIPVARGGPSEKWNLQILCEKCNQRKGSKIWLIL